MGRSRRPWSKPVELPVAALGRHCCTAACSEEAPGVARRRFSPARNFANVGEEILARGTTSAQGKKTRKIDGVVPRPQRRDQGLEQPTGAAVCECGGARGALKDP